MLPSSRLLALLIALVVAPAALSVQFASNEVVVPIAGRTPGAHGAVWQTDLTISNLTPEYASLNVLVEFFGTRGERATFDLSIAGMDTVTIEDFVRTRLGLGEALGLVRIRAEQSDARLLARAWVYEAGGIDAGQNVPALPLPSLARSVDLAGLGMAPGTRTNIGFSNPNDVPAEVEYGTMPTHPADRLRVTVPPHSVVQLPLPAGLGHRPIRVDANVPLYVYASTIRNATADATFIIGNPVRQTSDFVVAPSCSEPAPLNLADEPAPGWIVVFREGTDSAAATQALAMKYRFTPSFVYGVTLPGFAADLTPEMISGIRCEPVVRAVNQNAVGWFGMR